MSNIEMLQKLTEGMQQTENVVIQFNDEDYEFTMRPLSDGELSKLRKLENDTFSIKFNIDQNGKRRGRPQKEENSATINGGEFSESRDLVKYTAIALSLSVNGEEVSIDDVKKLAPGLPDLLFEHVISISALSKEDLNTIQNFRKDN